MDLIPGWGDPLEKEMATHSSILAWETPWTEKPGGYSKWSCKRVGHNLVMKQNNNLRQPHKQGFPDLGQLFFHTELPSSPWRSRVGLIQELAHVVQCRA